MANSTLLFSGAGALQGDFHETKYQLRMGKVTRAHHFQTAKMGIITSPWRLVTKGGFFGRNRLKPELDPSRSRTLPRLLKPCAQTGQTGIDLRSPLSIGLLGYE